MQYFKHEKLKEHLYRIIDITGVCCYLVVGEEKACLLDTCGGIGNIKEYVETITDKPIMVVLTHGHLDHIGGASLFEEVYMPHEDMPVLKMHNDFEFRVNDTLKHDPTGKVRREDFTPDITGEIKNISSAILAKCLIAFIVAAAAASINDELLPVTIVPSCNSKATAGQISFSPAISFNLADFSLAGTTTLLSVSLRLTSSIISLALS